MGEAEDRSERRRHARIELHVDLVYDSYSSFLAAAHGNLSRSGMFLTVEEPAPVGAVVSFEARLRGGGRLIRGEGQVVWVRTADATDGAPSGMAVRFLRLTPAAKKLIDELVERNRGAGGKVRLDGVRIEPAPAGHARPGDREQPALPWHESAGTSTDAGSESELPVSEDPGVPVGPGARPGPPQRPVRTTDKTGVEFDFSLIPDDGREPIRPRMALDPERKIMIALVLVLFVAGVLFVGPWQLIGFGYRIAHVLVATARKVVASDQAPVATPRPVPSPASEGSVPPAAGGLSEQPAPADEVQVRGVVWRRDDRGIEVTIELSRPVAPQTVSHSRVTDPNRHVIRLAGVTSYEGRPVLEVRGRELSGIRVGLHRDRDPPELHVVLDLADGKVEVEPQPIQGAAIRIRLRSQGGG